MPEQSVSLAPGPGQKNSRQRTPSDFNFSHVPILSLQEQRPRNRGSFLTSCSTIAPGRKNVAQRKSKPGPSSAPERKKAHRANLPDLLKKGIESLSGMSMAGVKVHYNSPHSEKLNAAAHTQGPEIHIGPGQEKHLAHEAWHVVQQRQGRVKPTLEFASTPINDDPDLEREADVMGAKAAAGAKTLPVSSPTSPSPAKQGGISSNSSPSSNSAVAQRVLLKADGKTPHKKEAKFTHLARKYRTNSAIMQKVQAMHDDPTIHQMTLKQAVEHCRASKKAKKTTSSELVDYNSSMKAIPKTSAASKKRKRREIQSETRGGALHEETHNYDPSGGYIEEKESKTTGMHFVPGTRQDAHDDESQTPEIIPWENPSYDGNFLKISRRPPKNMARAHRSPGFGDMQAGKKFHNVDVTSTERNQQHSKFEAKVRRSSAFKKSKKFDWKTKTTHQPVAGNEDEIAEALAKKEEIRRNKKRILRKVLQAKKQRPKVTIINSDQRTFTAEDGTKIESGDLGKDVAKLIPPRYLSEDADILAKYARAQRHGGNQKFGEVEMLSSDDSSSDFEEEEKSPRKDKKRKTRPPTEEEAAVIREKRKKARERYEQSGKIPKNELEEYFDDTGGM